MYVEKKKNAKITQKKSCQIKENGFFPDFTYFILGNSIWDIQKNKNNQMHIYHPKYILIPKKKLLEIWKTASQWWQDWFKCQGGSRGRQISKLTNFAKITKHDCVKKTRKLDENVFNAKLALLVSEFSLIVCMNRWITHKICFF